MFYILVFKFFNLYQWSSKMKKILLFSFSFFIYFHNLTYAQSNDENISNILFSVQYGIEKTQLKQQYDFSSKLFSRCKLLHDNQCMNREEYNILEINNKIRELDTINLFYEFEIKNYNPLIAFISNVTNKMVSIKINQNSEFDIYHYDKLQKNNITKSELINLYRKIAGKYKNFGVNENYIIK